MESERTQTTHPTLSPRGGATLKLIAQTCLLALVFFFPQPGHATEPSDLCTGNPCSISGSATVDPGAVLDFGSDTQLVFESSASVTIGPNPDGTENLRRVVFQAGSITMLSGSEIDGGCVTSAVDSCETGTRRRAAPARARRESMDGG